MIPENPELYGVGAIVVALITAWTKMKPETEKLKNERDNSLRADLLSRIKTLEDNQFNERREHVENVNRIRNEYEAIITRMEEKYERAIAEYELKLKTVQAKLDMVMDALLASREKGH